MSELLDNLNEIELQKASFIIPKNLKKDVKALGVTGTLEYLDTTDATAQAKDIKEGQTAYVNDVKITGNLQYEPSDFSLNGIIGDPVSTELKTSGDTKYIQLKYKRSGVDTIVGGSANVTANLQQETMAVASGITADKIKKDVEILGITGTYEGIDTTDADAIASDILINKTAYVNNTKITGAMLEMGKKVVFPTENKVTLNNGHYTSVDVPASINTETYRNCMDVANMILNGQELASAYEQLEYIESTGTQYVKLDFPQTQTALDDGLYDMYLDASFTSIPSGFKAIGIGTMANVLTLYRALFYVGISNGKFAFSDCDNDDWTTSVPADTLRHMFYVKSGSSESDRGFYIDDIQLSNSGAMSTKCNFKYRFYLFGYESDNGFVGANIRLHRLTIKRHTTGATMFDFVPAIQKGSTPVIGVYDKIQNRFYSNMGSGTFLYKQY